MFRAIDELPLDLRKFVAEPGSLKLPFSFASDDVGTAIIQIAAGKAPLDLLRQDGKADTTVHDDLRSAAQRFVAKVMLATGSDLFTVLGVSSGDDPRAFRDNYRRLMAMVHPDARPTGFPNDAAIRVNHAYAVLSDPEQLINYQTQHAEALAHSVAARSGALPTGNVAQRPAPELRFGSTGAFARVGALLFQARERGLLLWLALFMLAPLGGALYVALSGSPQVRLVEARPKLELSRVSESLTSSANQRSSPPAMRAGNPGTLAVENTQPAIRKTSPAVSTRSDVQALSPTLAFETSLSTSNFATRLQPAATVPMPNLGPTPSKDNLQLRIAVNSAAEQSPPALPLAAIAVTRPDAVLAEKPPPVSAASVTASLKALPVEQRAPVTTAIGTAVTYRLRSLDVEEVLARFSSAYETGSISAFDQVLALGMPGRGQLLTDYGRVFQGTRSRSIRFIQLKHAPAGERMTTRGYAEVITTDQEYRVSKQRVYLEIEIGLHQSVARIERLANYVVN